MKEFDRVKAQINEVLKQGKNVFIIMAQNEKCYVHSGRTEYSGTGRNVRATNILEEFDNIEFLRNGERCRENSEEVMKAINKKADLGVNTPKHLAIKRETNEKYDTIDKLKEKIDEINLPIDKNDYFIKKAEIILADILRRE